MDLLNDEEFSKLSHLCRIACSEEEKKILKQKISRIISHVRDLQELDTEGVSPCYQVNTSSIHLMREDTEGPLLSREEFLSASPSHIGGMIKVPPVMKHST
jgi:aspartyl-tRNA(Asn)/glutamyl-tRNA(Gln) amidotransferase subunit C